MIEGSIWRGMIAFAVPIFLGNLFQQLYNTADTLIVGNFLGKEALAAVSSSGNLIFMLVGFLNGMSMGAGVLIARYYGAKNHERLKTAIHTAIAFALVAGAAMSVVGVVLTPQILRWMGTPENALPSSIAYFRTYFYGCMANFLYNITTGILHSVGDSRRPLYYLIISSIVNVVLDLLFVGVFHWGVASAAAATVISQGVSALLGIRRLVRTDEVYHLDLRKIRLDMDTLKLMVRFGLPSGVQNSLNGFANVVVQANINSFGDSAMAGCGTFAKIEGFAFLPVTCFAMALSTFVSQNLGAKQYDRVKKGTRFGILCSVTLAELVGVLIYIFVPQLMALFNDDPEVLAYGVQHGRTLALFFCLLALTHCVGGVLRGAGKAMVSMCIMLATWCILRVVYITVGLSICNEIWVIYTAYPLTWACSSAILLFYYFKVDWLHSLDRLE